MKTFWDLEEEERAALTREEVERYLDAELMTKGVLKVAPLVLDEEPTITEPPSETFYVVGPVAFANAGDAQTFLKLSPVTVATKYLGGGYNDSLSVAERLERDVTEKRLTLSHLFEAAKGDLDRRAAVRSSNTKRRTEHQAGCKEQEKVLSGVWEDWLRCRNVDEAHRRVVATFKDYVKTAGDELTAARFLGKVFTFEQIAEARRWTGFDIPDPDFPECAPEPAPPREATADDVCF